LSDRLEKKIGSCEVCEVGLGLYLCDITCTCR
jgi:hypothetical protein